MDRKNIRSSVTTIDVGVEERNQPKIDAKGIKFQESVGKGEVDQISVLPNFLLLEILSRLPYTKYAIRTTMLSKRWKHLWTLLPTLMFWHKNDSPKWSDFISMLDKTLTQHRLLKLKKLEVHIIRYNGLASHVNNWIRYAIRCNVEELHLSLRHLYSKCEFVVGQFFYNSSCFIDQTLDCCILNPTMRISWKILKSLCISNEKLDEDLIENILSGSPVLETLQLCHCYGYRRLDITSKSIKDLVFSGYFDHEDYNDAVEANLNYTHMGKYEKSLYEVVEEMLKGFILNLRHSRSLKLGNCVLR
ncbi:hypothetical protein Lser_V15G32389 [Lactuca serriola]